MGAYSWDGYVADLPARNAVLVWQHSLTGTPDLDFVG
jgi:hypothetical protein